MRRTLVTSLTLLLLGAGEPYSVRLTIRSCHPMPAATAQALGGDWVGLAQFAQRCTVLGPDRRPALTVDVIRLDHAFRIDFFATHRDQQVPVPIIRDRTGTVVGELIEQFPVDPPGRMSFTFARWQDGWPREIRMVQMGESAIAPHPLSPMRWDEAARTYRWQP